VIVPSPIAGDRTIEEGMRAGGGGRRGGVPVGRVEDVEEGIGAVELSQA
jgi:hypothetical protein